MKISRQTYLKEKLKEKVQEKAGLKINVSEDYKLLVQKIYDITGRRISITALKRLYSMVPASYHPSGKTLDTLSSYIGFNDWNAFIEAGSIDRKLSYSENYWDAVKENAGSLTEVSLGAIIKKTGYNQKSFIKRNFAEEYYQGFYQSGKTFAILVAPDGYGKSSVVLQWYHIHFSSSNDHFVPDNICLVDGHRFLNFLKELPGEKFPGFQFYPDDKLINEISEPDEGTFRIEKPVLIIDDVDRIFSSKGKNYQFIEHIFYQFLNNRENFWYRVIFTCRPENFDLFTSFLKKEPNIAEYFFNVSYPVKNHFEAINVPVLNQREIKAFLKNNKCKISFQYLSLFHPDMLRVIHIPLYLPFILREGELPARDFSEIKFFNQIIRHFIGPGIYEEEKQVLINKFLGICKLDEDVTFVAKNVLLEGMDGSLAYQELTESGLLYEYAGPQDFSDNHQRVRFSNKHVFEYLMAWHLLRRGNRYTELLNALFTQYNHNIPTQYNLLKWLIKIAFYDQNEKFLMLVHQFFEHRINITKELSGEEMPGILRLVHSTFIPGLRVHKRSCEALMPWFAKLPLGRKLYFEEYFDMDNLIHSPESSLEIYTGHYSTADANLAAGFIRFMKGFYLQDHGVCAREYEKISGIDFTELTTDYFLGCYFSIYYLYGSLNNNRDTEGMIENVMSISSRLRMKSAHSFRYIPSFDFFLVYNLNTCDLFDEIKTIAEHSNRIYDFTQMNASPFYHFYKLCHARALLHTGEANRALVLFQQLGKAEFPIHLKHFMKINVNLARADFMKYQKKTAEALRLLSEANSLAKLMGYNYFINKTSEVASIILKAGKDILNG